MHAHNVRDSGGILARQADVCVLCPVPGPEEEQLGARLLDLRHQFPHVLWVALFFEGQSDSRWALRLGQAGVTELVTVGRSLPSAALMSALSRCETDSVAVRIWKEAHLGVPDSLVALLKPALRLAHGPVSMTRLAAATRMHERTLRKYCDGANLPSPQWIVGWARLLVAAYYLDEPGRTIHSIAELLEFPSAVALANHVRRYTQMTPSNVRAQGALWTIARAVESFVVDARARTIRGRPQPHIFSVA
jgi:AraC-like DNA-binding protein